LVTIVDRLKQLSNEPKKLNAGTTDFVDALKKIEAEGSFAGKN